ncbi:hypothetical protein P5673_011073 [Acropora cervicornis]|uniref:Uncharacterized protein n=1 Tax=Acropora cervicornis TaxID=6130 RepID=A0AAD9QPX2_ACRCE|nr:hypothetical protein P5673_011073 [Acropora cervicornis]
MKQKRKVIQSLLILIFSTSASPASIIGHSTSSSSISIQSSRQTDSLQLETLFTTKEDVASSSTYFVTAPSASPTSIIAYSKSSSSISVQSLWETESLQWKIEPTIKGDSLSSSIYPFTTVSPAVSTVLTTTVSSNTGPQSK